MKTIFIGGEDRPVCVGWGTLKEFGKQTGRPFAKLFTIEDLDFDDIEKLIFVSLKWGAKEGGKDFAVKIGDVEGWLNKDIKVVFDFMEIFAEEVTVAEKNPEAPATGR